MSIAEFGWMSFKLLVMNAEAKVYEIHDREVSYAFVLNYSEVKS